MTFLSILGGLVLLLFGICGVGACAYDCGNQRQIEQRRAAERDASLRAMPVIQGGLQKQVGRWALVSEERQGELGLRAEYRSEGYGPEAAAFDADPEGRVRRHREDLAAPEAALKARLEQLEPTDLPNGYSSERINELWRIRQELDRTLLQKGWGAREWKAWDLAPHRMLVELVDLVQNPASASGAPPSGETRPRNPILKSSASAWTEEDLRLVGFARVRTLTASSPSGASRLRARIYAVDEARALELEQGLDLQALASKLP